MRDEPIPPRAEERPLFRALPALAGRVPWARLGDFPTPVEPLPGYPDGFLKREDLSSRLYGGNKVRTLEAHLGRAVSRGATIAWATGAYGSNHAVATALHARALGLEAGAAIFPQPPTRPAKENLAALLAARPRLFPMANVVFLPAAMIAIHQRARRRGEAAYLMTPGGATPVGALGHVGAGLELAEQVAAGQIPPPATLILPVGSTCTTAGLLVGLHLAGRLGIGFGPGLAPLPQVIAVRVTPWPVTSPTRIAHLARRTAVYLEKLAGPLASFGFRELRASLTVEGRYFGGGYGRPTATGRFAADSMRLAGGPPLDTVYAAKAGAAFFDAFRNRVPRPILFWTTKSSAPLPPPDAATLRAAPAPLRRWLARPALDAKR